MAQTGNKTKNKTQPTGASVAAFVAGIQDADQRKEANILLKLFAEASGEKPKMWGSSIVGYGQYHYKYASGREGDAGLTGFSPRRGYNVVYITPGFKPYGDLMKKLGKYKIGASCLYIKTLSDIHLPTLKELVRASVQDMRKNTGVNTARELASKALIAL